MPMTENLEWGSEEWVERIRAEYAAGKIGLRGLRKKYEIGITLPAGGTRHARDIVNRCGAYGPGRASQKGAARKYGGYRE